VAAGWRHLLAMFVIDPGNPVPSQAVVFGGETWL
jgi:hypothetical protein